MRHPKIEIPDLGLMDHAWDLLGEWEARMELFDIAALPVRFIFYSWDAGRIEFRKLDANKFRWPNPFELIRVRKVRRVEDGGGAIRARFVSISSPPDWRIHMDMWPGLLNLFAWEKGKREYLWQAKAWRTRMYFLKKYP